MLKDVVVASPQILPDLPENIRNFVAPGCEENDVLSRFHAFVLKHRVDYIVRLTADCPLLDPRLIDCVIYHGQGADYCSNVLEPGFPDGTDVEMISASTLKMLHNSASKVRDREHVTIMLRESEYLQKKLNIVSIESLTDYSDCKVSVDTEEDLERVRGIEKEMLNG